MLSSGRASRSIAFSSATAFGPVVEVAMQESPPPAAPATAQHYQQLQHRTFLTSPQLPPVVEVAMQDPPTTPPPAATPPAAPAPPHVAAIQPINPPQLQLQLQAGTPAKQPDMYHPPGTWNRQARKGGSPIRLQHVSPRAGAVADRGHCEPRFWQIAPHVQIRDRINSSRRQDCV